MRVFMQRDTGATLPLSIVRTKYTVLDRIWQLCVLAQVCYHTAYRKLVYLAAKSKCVQITILRDFVFCNQPAHRHPALSPSNSCTFSTSKPFPIASCVKQEKAQAGLGPLPCLVASWSTERRSLVGNSLAYLGPAA